jgi:hypothetical protein
MILLYHNDEVHAYRTSPTISSRITTLMAFTKCARVCGNLIRERLT